MFIFCHSSQLIDCVYGSMENGHSADARCEDCGCGVLHFRGSSFAIDSVWTSSGNNHHADQSRTCASNTPVSTWPCPFTCTKNPYTPVCRKPYRNQNRPR